LCQGRPALAIMLPASRRVSARLPPWQNRPAAPRRPLANGYIPPYIPTRAYKVQAGADWVHEIKHDGYKFAATATRSGCSPVAATTLTGRVLE
jgi:hypothetical protein